MIGTILFLASIVFGIWFLNGWRKVIFLPRFVLSDYQKFKAKGRYGDDETAVRLEVMRQQYCPPFLLVKETWTKVRGEEWVRIPDGFLLSDRCSDHQKLNGLVLAHCLDKAHTERLESGDIDT